MQVNFFFCGSITTNPIPKSLYNSSSYYYYDDIINSARLVTDCVPNDWHIALQSHPRRCDSHGVRHTQQS